MLSFYNFYKNSGKNMGKFGITKDTSIYLLEFSFLEWILEGSVL